MRKNGIKEKYHDRRQEIFIVGDSHVGGYAGEILQHGKQLFTITGCVKHKAGVLKLSNTAKEEISKLNKMNTYIFIFSFGGTNDIKRNLHGRSLTLIETFLVDSRHTNVILMGVPLRSDLNEGSGINP